MSIYVRFDSVEYDEPQFIGPFQTVEAADDYADDRNDGLSMNGIPGHIVSYSVSGC